MRVDKKVFLVLMIVLLYARHVPVIATPDLEYSHSIAGYGPVYGDFYDPVSAQVHENKIYVLDKLGISIFDLSTRAFLNKLPVDLQSEEAKQEWNTPKKWSEILQGFGRFDMFMVIFEIALARRLIEIPYSRDKIQVKNDLFFDSEGRLFVLTRSGIRQIDTKTGSTVREIPLPEMDQVKPIQDGPVRYSFLLQDDLIYLLRSKSYDRDDESSAFAKVFVLSLDGKIEKEIQFDVPEGTFFYDSNDFVFLSETKLFGIVGIDFGDDDYRCITFFDMNGKAIETKGDGSNFIDIICYQKPNKFYVSAIDDKASGLGVTALYKFNFSIEDGAINLTKPKKISSGLIGDIFIDICSSEDVLTIITSGPLTLPKDYRVLFSTNDKDIQRIGSVPSQPGQTLGSFAFSADRYRNLFETSFMSRAINQYDKNGNYISSIDLDKKLFFQDFIFETPPSIVDMEVEGNYLYCVTLYPATVRRYSFKEKTWEQVYYDFLPEEDIDIHIWTNMRVNQGTVFLLSSLRLIDNAPDFMYITDDNELKNISLLNSPVLPKEDQPYFIGLTFTEQEYLFLDSNHQEIWIYNREDGKLVERMKLPTRNTSFFTSFDLYPDGSFLLTDVIQSTLVHVSRKGDVLETIGSRGDLEIGGSKESYQSIPDRFNKPIRAKIANQTIYVSDLFNCRYHIIPLEKQSKPEPKPTIQWERESILFENFSVFSEKLIEITYQVIPDKEVSYQLSTSNPWIILQSPSSSASEKKISFIIVGSKLNPWQTNKGSFLVTFPDYPELNKEFPITVVAIGNIVKITIGSTKASLNDLAIELDTASIPLLKEGRTYVGIRFIGETVFKAKVSYVPQTRSVIFELGDKKIELLIDQPYALVNSTRVPLSAPPFILNGRTFVPLRFISENLDATVDYEPKTQTITIYNPSIPR